MDVYSHIAPSFHEEVAGRMDARFGRPFPSPFPSKGLGIARSPLE